MTFVAPELRRHTLILSSVAPYGPRISGSTDRRRTAGLVSSDSESIRFRALKYRNDHRPSAAQNGSLPRCAVRAIDHGLARERPPRESIRSGFDRVLPSGKKLQPLSAKTIRNRHGLLSSSFNRVVPGLLPANPLRGLRLPAGRQVDMVFLTSQEWWLLHDCTGVFWQPFTTVLVGTGMRFAEATALQVGDVDLDARRVRVTKAWKEDENGHRYIGPPTSPAGIRSIGFDAHLHQILTKACQARAGTSLVFVNRAGQPILNSSFHSRVWTPAIDKARTAGLTKRPRPHDLRHTFASWALADGAVNIWKLAKIMGHDVEVTQKRYAHLMEGSLTDVARAIGAGLKRQQT
jgi:integrase